jgi:uncharacterized protein YqgC (DUF456 family)
METALVISLIVLGLFVSLLGLVGCILPFLPGPPLSFAALLILSLAKDWEPFGAVFLVVMGVLSVAVSVLDYVFPAAGARKYGASRYGAWGSFIGMIAGVILLSGLGVLIGGLAGAVAGELLAGKERDQALRAGWGAFLGNVLGVGVKLALSGAMLFYYVKALF